ncbi:MAG: hypothetical protein C4538_08110 [Nitrospiraceae bacterium]|nr:MAG: hypothetical protein C4538_08110 [Nitrospiraceae bacterium]
MQKRVWLRLMAVLAALITSVAALSGFLYSFSGSGTMPGMFFSSFVLLSIAVFGFICVMIFLVSMIISAVVSVVEGGGAGDTFRKTYGFLTRNPQAIFLPVLFFIVVMLVNIGLFAARFSYNIIPIFFPFTFILSVFTAVLQNYLTVIAWGFLVSYYIKASGRIDSSREYEI